MIVTLMGSSNSIRLAETAAAVCVGRADYLGTNHQIPEAWHKGFRTAITSGHWSILEHLSFTWLVKNISRACSHQLVRHRIASYSQESQRYCKINTSSAWYKIPDSIVGTDYDYYARLMNDIAYLYNDLLNNGVPPEDARMVLPNACLTTILVTMNGRAFIEAAQKRLCGKAQSEIREMFSKMRDTLLDVVPDIYYLAKPKCYTDKCPEAKPCKNRPEY